MVSPLLFSSLLLGEFCISKPETIGTGPVGPLEKERTKRGTKKKDDRHTYPVVPLPWIPEMIQRLRSDISHSHADERDCPWRPDDGLRQRHRHWQWYWSRSRRRTLDDVPRHDGPGDLADVRRPRSQSWRRPTVARRTSTASGGAASASASTSTSTATVVPAPAAAAAYAYASAAASSWSAPGDAASSHDQCAGDVRGSV